MRYNLFNQIQVIVSFKNLKAYSLAIVMLIPLCSFAEVGDQDSKKENRPEMEYKQRHSKSNQSDLYADGIKIQRDFSLIKDAQEERVLNMDEIPSDDLYGGIWNSRYVNVYGSLENIPSQYTVDLSNFTMPTLGYTTSNYGHRGRRMHHGIDLKVQIGDTIYAAFDGKVRLCQFERRGYGYYVVLRHPNGLETVYGHLSQFLVSPDDVVKSGDPIALGGNTGRSTGSHLHFETRFLGKSIDPTEIVDFENKHIKYNTYVVNTARLGTPGSSSSAKSVVKRSPGTKTNKYATGTVSYYRIKKGDTLGAIAKRHGTTVSKLCKLNSMSTKEVLRLGKSIRVS